MSDAMAVALDALRMAGRDDVADAWAFVTEAVRLREWLIEHLECDVEGYCAACGVHSSSEPHRLSCRLVPLLATQPGWSVAEFDRAWDAAVREQILRNAFVRYGRMDFRLGHTADAEGYLTRVLSNTSIEASEHMKDGAVYVFQRLPPADVSFGSPHHRAVLTNIDYDPPPTEKEKK
jgi:hypothetical protein